MIDQELGTPIIEQEPFSSRLEEALVVWQGAREEAAKEAVKKLIFLVDQATFAGNDISLKVTKEAAGQWPNNIATIKGREGVEEEDDGWVFVIPAGGPILTKSGLTLTRIDEKVVVKGYGGSHFAWFSSGDVVSLTCRKSEEADSLPDLGDRRRWAVGGRK